METKIKEVYWLDCKLPKQGSIIQDYFGTRFNVIKVIRKGKLVTLEEIQNTHPDN